MNTTQTSQSTERILLEAVETMRKNPQKYRELHKELKAARSDEDRVKRLLSFATSDRELATLMPSGTTQTETAAAVTTVTVTTVFIIVDTAY